VRVGFIGLGTMGYPMAGCVARAFDTTVWNRTQATAQRHAGEHGSRAGSLAEVAASDVIVSCLKNSDVVEAVVRQALEHLRPGSVWVDCTSGSLPTSLAVAALLDRRAVPYLDAPVSGMAAAAAAGTLTILVGGAASTLESARPVLAVMGSPIVHVGPTGSGHLAKAANNALFAASLWAASEALAALSAHGIAPDRALAAVNASSGRSQVTEQFLPTCVFTDPPAAPFALGDLAKDVRNAAQAAGTDESTMLSDLARRYGELADRIGDGAGAAQTFRRIARGSA
jgi:3-hydroxyisobutyrate dehydrogenase